MGYNCNIESHTINPTVSYATEELRPGQLTWIRKKYAADIALWSRYAQSAYDESTRDGAAR